MNAKEKAHLTNTVGDDQKADYGEEAVCNFTPRLTNIAQTIMSNLLSDAILKEIERLAHRVCIDTLGREMPVPTQTPWMTETQLAEYWQMRNKVGELTVHAIRKWTARPTDEHPLPCAQMGDMRRYHRDEVDAWAREEAVRQRQKRKESRHDNLSEDSNAGNLQVVR